MFDLSKLHITLFDKFLVSCCPILSIQRYINPVELVADKVLVASNKNKLSTKNAIPHTWKAYSKFKGVQQSEWDSENVVRN